MDAFGMSFDMMKFAGTASSFVTWLKLIFLMIFILLLIWGCFYIISFKRMVRIRQSTASGYVIIDTKAREFKTKDGVVKWRFLKWIRQSYVAPPVEYFEFTRKGKFSVECDRDKDGNIKWRKISGDPNKGDSFTGEERLTTAMEMRRANEYNKQGIMDKLFSMAPVIMCVIIVVLIFAFWGDFVKTTSDAAVKAADASEKLANAMSMQNDILSKCEGNINWSQYQKITVDNKGKDLPPIPN